MKSEIPQLLVGTWVHKQDLDKDSFRYVKADKFEKHTKGFVFTKDGKVEMYMPLGCQLPPNFAMFHGNWRVLNRNTIEIDRHFPGEAPDRMKLVKLNNRVLRFVWN